MNGIILNSTTFVWYGGVNPTLREEVLCACLFFGGEGRGSLSGHKMCLVKNAY